jgi:hypothetical protein
MEEAMEAAAKILTASRAELLPGERAGEISCIAPDSEPVCARCKGAGWLQVGKWDVPEYAQCDCRIAKQREIVRVCRWRIRIRVELGGREKVVTVDPENVIREEQICHLGI